MMLGRFAYRHASQGLRRAARSSRVSRPRTCSTAATSQSSIPRLLVALDMDETMIHSIFSRDDGTHRQMEERKELAAGGQAGESFTVVLDDEEIQVNVRPGLTPFLEQASELFDLVVFTAAQQSYADKVLDVIDPNGSFFRARFYRPTCTIHAGYYAKDLMNVLVNDDVARGRPNSVKWGDLSLALARVVLVDNNPATFLINPHNGVPIESFYDDPEDNDLEHLLVFLKALDTYPDVRPQLIKQINLASQLESIFGPKARL